jgi:hypothetical protein
MLAHGKLAKSDAIEMSTFGEKSGRWAILSHVDIPNSPSRILHRPTWIQAIESNENRAMIGPRSVLPLLPAARSNEASFCIRFIEAFFSTVAFAAGMKAA